MVITAGYIQPLKLCVAVSLKLWITSILNNRIYFKSLILSFRQKEIYQKINNETAHVDSYKDTVKQCGKRVSSLRSKPADKERLIVPASGYQCLLLSLVELIEVLTGLKNEGEQN